MEPEATPAGRREAMIQLLRLGGVATATAGLGVWLSGRGHRPEEPGADTVRPNFQVPAEAALPEMVVIQGDDPARLARRAIQELGGIRRFISRGDVVVIKPNICTAREPKYAATTNPTVVATLVALCLAAKATSVHVMDFPINSSAASAYKTSGIGAVVAKTSP